MANPVLRTAQPQTMDQEQDLWSQVITDYIPLVERMTRQLARRLPASIEVEDLTHVGLLGLMEAIGRFDPSRPNKFKTFAEHRIRGAMIDELRRIDHLPRNVRDDLKDMEKARLALERETGRDPSDEEVAGRLQWDIETYHKKRSRSGGETLLEPALLEATTVPAEGFLTDPIQNTERLQLREKFIELLKGLSYKQRRVMEYYYYQDLRLREIAGRLKVTESRVSQLHRRALQKLAAMMQQSA